MLFKEIIAVYTYNENLTKPISKKNSELQIFKPSGIYFYHWALKDHISENNMSCRKQSDMTKIRLMETNSQIV
jgi:hypothetical protein